MAVGLLPRFYCSGTDVPAKAFAVYAGTRTPPVEPHWLAGGFSQYIIPSSVFEVLIIPDDGKISPKELSELVVSTNEQAVKDSEILSDHAYYYDATEKKFRTV